MASIRCPNSVIPSLVTSGIFYWATPSERKQIAQVLAGAMLYIGKH